MWRMFLQNIIKNEEAAVCKMFFRNSRPELFCQKGVLRDFAKLTEKHVCQRLFINKVAGQSTGASREFAKFWRKPFLTEHLWWLLLVLQNRCSYKFPDIHQKISLLKSLFNTVRGLKASSINKKETPTLVFSCEYDKIFKKSSFIEHLRWLFLNMVEEFLRFSNSR